MEIFYITLLIICIVLVLIVLARWSDQKIKKQINGFTIKKATPEKTTVDWPAWYNYAFGTDPEPNTEPRCLEQESLQNLQNTAVGNVTPGVSAQNAADALKDAFADAAKTHPTIYGNWDYAKVCHRCGNCEAECESKSNLYE